MAEIDYDFGEDDLIAFLDHHVRNAPAVPRRVKRSRWIAGGGFLGAAALFADISLPLAAPGPDFKTQRRHVAPRRHLAVILTGTLEVECSPSEVSRFGPGSLVVLEDTTGEGHVTRIVEAPVSFVQIALKP